MKKLLKFTKNFISFRGYCEKAINEDLVRNIGILAHIDAGKTTTTERMLFYSGKIRSMGEVHHGNTVTDFLDQERERGITISSAAVSLFWKKHQFNLIDTPGHIDFTVEVERSLNVLDGAIVILDGSAGVEAQTVTVWRQADRYDLPRIIYLNKMDRPDASLDVCLDSLRSKLGIQPLLLHLPIYGSDEQFEGVVDVVSLKQILWPKGDGRKFLVEDLKDQCQLWEDAIEMRNNLVENLADYDDSLAYQVIVNESHGIPSKMILDAVSKVTLAQKGVPVLCGSSYKNIGVQALMDAVILFLPSPREKNKLIHDCFGNELCARAFKVVYDGQKKPITYLRVYSGSMTKGQKIYNIQKEKSEQISRLMVPYADETLDAPIVTAGNIAAVAGFKDTATGDFITVNGVTAAKAKKKLSNFQSNSFHLDFGHATKIPVPVFFCSIEAPSQAYQSQLDLALHNLQREDPSLVVFQDEATSQTILGGMGELHIDIIKNRIISEYKVNVELGSLQIAYQEIPNEWHKKETCTLEHRIGISNQKATITLSLVPRNNTVKDILLFDRSPEYAQNIAKLLPRTVTAITRGVKTGLSHGPTLGYPITDVSVMLHYCEISRGTTEESVSAAATQCVQKILKSVGTTLREPVMNVEVVMEKDKLSLVLADLSRRRAVIQHVVPRALQQVISVLVPLSELLGYAAELRCLTSGTASFSMELDSYQAMSSSEEAKAVKRVTGFDP